MCGIAGYVGFAELDPSRIDAALTSMRHRGPDALRWKRYDLAKGRKAFLLHARLSIIDLGHHADQPFETPELSLAFNGEIYNYIELRRDLEQRHAFATRSDTEVLARLLAEQGMSGLDRCEGMWAFAAIDHRRGEVFLARDPFGEKPLYVMRTEDGLYFASEPKTLFQLSGVSPKINYDHLRRYLVNGYKSLYKKPQTFFSGIDEIPQAHMMRIDADGVEHSARYWSLTFEPDESMSRAQAVEAVREHVIDAVRIRLRSDVPLAFCQSGGVDSNTCLSIAKKVCGYDVHGFTIVNRDQRYNETEDVAAVTAALGIRHTDVPVRRDDFLPNLRSLVRGHDAPVYTISYYAHWLLMENMAAAGYKVSLSGTGADELFSGYYDHHNFHLAHLARRRPAAHAEARALWERHIKPLVRNPILENGDAFIESPDLRDHIYLGADEFSTWLTEPFSEPFQETKYTDDLLRNRMMNELFHEAVPVILHEDDANAMRCSIENRSPFLDRRLARLCYTIPTHLLIKDGFAKSILRDAMRDIVPNSVLDNRRKVGFNAPVLDFLDLNDLQTREWLLDDGPIFNHVRKDKIADLLQASDMPNSMSKILFYFVNAKIFVEEFT